jgi:DNA-directed RNA polymerase specialized sigma24 family protein
MHRPAQLAEDTWVPLDYVPAEAVRDAARTLPADHRIALYLTDVEGLSYRQAARVMETSPGAVAARLRQARRRLRAMLVPESAELLRRSRVAAGVGMHNRHGPQGS